MKLPAFVLLTVLLFGSTGNAATDPGPPAQFVKGSPARYEAISTVIMQYRWFKFPALGVLAVDARHGDFALAGLSQLGIQVFSLSEKNGVTTSHIPAKILKRNPKMADSAAKDVRNMFFDLAPQPGAQVRESGSLLVFTQPTDNGILEYRYDKESGLLLEKRFSAPYRFLPWGRVIWVVSYGNYATSGSKTFPCFVRFKNRKLNYAVSTIVKEMRIK